MPSGVNATSRLGGTKRRKRRGLRGCTRIFFFVISKWHILVNSEVQNLKYVIVILEYSHWMIDVPQPKYWGNWGICPRGIPNRVTPVYMPTAPIQRVRKGAWCESCSAGLHARKATTVGLCLEVIVQLQSVKLLMTVSSEARSRGSICQGGRGRFDPIMKWPTPLMHEVQKTAPGVDYDLMDVNSHL